MYSIVNLMTQVKDFCYINPSTLTGAIDVIVVEQPDGTFTCSPFHVRFGKIGVLRSKEKIVDIEINGKPMDFHMRLGDSGEAYFVEMVSGDDVDEVPRHLFCSPIVTSKDTGNGTQGFSADNVLKKDRSSPANDERNTECDTQKPKIFNAETSEVEVTNKVSSCNGDFRPIGMEAKIEPITVEEDAVVESETIPSEPTQAVDTADRIVEPVPKIVDGKVKGRRRKRSHMKRKNDTQMAVDENVVKERSKSSTARSGRKWGKGNASRGRAESAGGNMQTVPLHSIVEMESSILSSVGKPAASQDLASSNTSLELAGLRPSKDNDYHFFSESEMADESGRVGPRSAAIQSDSEVEKLTAPDSEGNNRSWRWGELPSPVNTVGNGNGMADAADAGKPDSHRSMLSSMFAFMQHNRKNPQPDASFPPQSSVPKDMYLSDLVADSLEPEVAALYFPRPQYRASRADYDAESESARASDENSEAEGTSSEEVVTSDDANRLENPESVPSTYRIKKRASRCVIQEITDPEEIIGPEEGNKPEAIVEEEASEGKDKEDTKKQEEIPESEALRGEGLEEMIDREAKKEDPKAVVDMEASGDMDKEEDAESGCGASVPGSPEAVFEGKSGTGVRKNLLRLKSQSVCSECQTENYAQDLEMSLCGGLADGGPSEEAFRDHLVTFADYQSNLKVVEDPQLVVRCLGKYYSWTAAAPLVVAQAFYRQQFSQQTVDQLTAAGLTPKAKEVNTYSSWWSWRKKAETSAAAATDPITETKTESPDASPKPASTNPEEAFPNIAYKKTLRLSSSEISRLNLQPGSNTFIFSVTSAYQGTTSCKCHVHRWRHDDRVVISDIDGTITKSDVLGHLMPMLGRDWAQSGVAQLFNKINKNGYRLLYLSARAIGQSRTTRSYLKSIKQEDLSLPEGPLLLSPTGLLNALHREVIDKKPEDFKIPCLKDILALFPADCNPFYAGFGNRVNDVWTYRAVGIPMFRIFTVNHRGELTHESSKTFKTTYYNLSEIGDHMFPPFKRAKMCEDYSSFVYWRVPIEEVVIDPVTKIVGVRG